MSKLGYSYLGCRDSGLAELSTNAPRNNNATKSPENNTGESNECPNNRSVSFVDGAKTLYIPSPREQDRGDYKIFSLSSKRRLTDKIPGLTIQEIDKNGRTGELSDGCKINN